MITKLLKKMKRLERKYQNLPTTAVIPRMRIIKSYQAAAAKLKLLTGRE